MPGRVGTVGRREQPSLFRQHCMAMCSLDACETPQPCADGPGCWAVLSPLFQQGRGGRTEHFARQSRISSVLAPSPPCFPAMFLPRPQRLSRCSDQQHLASRRCCCLALADRGYYSGEAIKACDDAGVVPLVPKVFTSNSKAEGRSTRATLSTSLSAMRSAARPASRRSAGSQASSLASLMKEERRLFFPERTVAGPRAPDP